MLNAVDNAAAERKLPFMTRLQGSALAIAGLVLSALGLFVVIAFALPALGLNTYGHNPLEFTIVAELVGGAIYLTGATMSWFAWDLIGRHGMLRGSAAIAVMPVAVLVIVLAVDVIHAYWINLVDTLAIVAGVMAPIVAGFRPWRRDRKLFRGSLSG